MPIKVLIVDDSDLFRIALGALLATDPGLSIVGEARDGAGALALVVACTPDVVVVDRRLPDVDGLDLIRRIKMRAPATGCVSISGHVDEEIWADAMHAGASAVVGKEHVLERLIPAIRSAAGTRPAEAESATPE